MLPSAPPPASRLEPHTLLAFCVGLLLAVAGVLTLGREDVPGRLILLGGMVVIGIGMWLVSRAPASAPPQGSFTAAALEVAAHALGWQLAAGKAVGTLDGVELEASVAGEELTVTARLRRPLDVGLLVAREGKRDDPRASIGLGTTGIDDRFTVLADEPGRLRPLMTPRVRALLEGAPDGLRVDDAGVTMWLYGVNAEQIEQAALHAAALAAALDQARLCVPCASLLASLRQAWEGDMVEGWKIGDTPLRLRGNVDGVVVAARAARDAFEHYHFELEARFDRPLGLQLYLRPHSKVQEADRLAEPLGYPRFDETFVASTVGVDAARLFDADIRARLLELRELGLQIRGNDEHIAAWFGFNRNDPAAIPRVLPELAGVAAMIAERAASLRSEP